MVGTVGLNGLLHNVPLSSICCTAIGRNGIIANEDLHVNFGLSDRFQLQGHVKLKSKSRINSKSTHHQSRLVAIGAVQTDTLKREEVKS